MRQVDPMRDDSNSPLKMDLMPMVDIVFQLIIFFMLVTEIKKRDLEIMELPRTVFARALEKANNRVVINIMWQGMAGTELYRIQGSHFTPNALMYFLGAEDDRVRRVMSRGRLGPSPLIVKIRADARVSWEAVRFVEFVCQRKAISHLEYGTERIRVWNGRMKIKCR